MVTILSASTQGVCDNNHLLDVSPEGVGSFQGVSRSRPVVSAFRTQLERSASELVYLSAFDIVNTSTDSVPEFVAGTHVINQLAGIIGRGYLEFINTDHTACDMVSIVKAHGRDKLYYWGFS